MENVKRNTLFPARGNQAAAAARGGLAQFWKRHEKRLLGILFVLPALYLLWQFSYGAFFQTLYNSVHLTNIRGQAVAFCGFDLYRSLLSGEEFWNSCLVSVEFVLLTVLPSLAAALALAALCRGRMPGGRLINVLFSMPVAVSSACVTMVFMTLLEPSMGLVNELLGLDLKWYLDSDLALVSVAMVVNWNLIAMDFIFLSAALRAVPVSYYESASLDGADGWKVFPNITLPSVSPTLFFLTVVNILQTFQAFGPINIMTGGGPSGATDVLSYSIYRDAFVNYQFSPAAAKSVLLFFILLGVTMVQMKSEKRRVFYQ